MTSFRPPSPALLRALLAPFGRYFSPSFLGLEALDLRRPAMFVGNHTLYGIADVPFLIEGIYAAHGVFLRSLGHTRHVEVPVWRELLTRMGMVVGTPETCAALMRTGQSILVFPGGAREVFRRADERYALMWKQRAGFARLAIEHGYDLIPFGAIGANENFRIVLDAGDLASRPRLQRVASRLGLSTSAGEAAAVPPLVFGLGPTPFPRPQRFYFGFGARIAPPAATAPREEAAWALRERAARAIEEQLDRLLAHRAEDHARWSPLRRALAPLTVTRAR